MLRKIDIARSWRIAREAYTSLIEERAALKRELAWTLQSLHELRADLAELKAAVLARQRVDAELADLYRERAIARARAAERDPAQPLQ